MGKVRLYVLALLFINSVPLIAVEKFNTIDYRIETMGIIGNGSFVPLWLTANRYGTICNEKNQVSLRAGLFTQRKLKHYWSLNTGIEVIGGYDLVSRFWFHQAYTDFSWRCLNISIGSKERKGGPLDKNPQLTGGWMVEGPNVRPIPQVRVEIEEYQTVPWTKHWLAVKGHIAYGMLLDGKWQEDFVGLNQEFTKNILYHSKSLMFRFGNKEKFPVEFELGIITGTQFGGKRFLRNPDGSIKEVKNMPNGIKEFFKVLIPKQKSTLDNVEGNHCGSWNFALNTYWGEWKVRSYMEHFFEDHSQMFWQYGRWKDGLLGIELVPIKNAWVTSIVWEGLATKNQTTPVLYDGVNHSFPDAQMSGNDHYYNNHEYLGWQYYGSTLGHPFLYGPLYNSDKSNEIKSTRVRANHLGISGNPTDEWNWRFLSSFSRHWGTYRKPLDKQRKQFSGLLEVTYTPQWAKGWSASVGCGMDRGNYLGNSTGGMFTLRKKGGFNL